MLSYFTSHFASELHPEHLDRTTSGSGSETESIDSPPRQAIRTDIPNKSAYYDALGRSSSENELQEVEEIKDPQALYDWAVTIHEKASVTPAGQARDALLLSVCDKYKKLCDLQATSHAVHYNWGVALSDRAKLYRGTGNSLKLWEEACRQYKLALLYDPFSPQAHNNLGLGFQQAASVVPALVKGGKRIDQLTAAVSHFSRAVYLQPDFHRAVYNLGTVFYGHALDLAPHLLHLSSQSDAAMFIRRLGACCMALASAQDPSKAVYRSSLSLVAKLLMPPHPTSAVLTSTLHLSSLQGLKTGGNEDEWVVGVATLGPMGLQISRATHQDSNLGVSPSPEEEAETSRVPWGVVPYTTLLHKYPDPGLSVRASGSDFTSSSSSYIIPISQVNGVEPISDLTMPSGWGIWIGTSSGSQYMVANNKFEMQMWIVALKVVRSMYNVDKCRQLSHVLSSFAPKKS